MAPGDLKDTRLMWLKAALFVLGALLCAALLWADAPSWRTLAIAALLGWCSARAYYFLFYVIEHYIDDTFTYAGLGALLRAWWRKPPSGPAGHLPQ